MTILDPAPQRTTDRIAHHRRPYLPVLALLITWTTMCLLAPRVHLGPELKEIALFGHLAALVLGFGAVLTLDWFGLMWMLGRQDLFALVRVARVVHTPIWLGLGGLALTGAMLTPDTSAPLTMVKLLAVLAVALNGLGAAKVQQRLLAMRGRALPRRLLATAVLTATVSQAGWWTATLIGFLNNQQ